MRSDFFTPLAERDGGFTPLGLVTEPVTEIARDKARSGYRIFRGGHGFEVAIPEDVVFRMLTFGRNAAPSEWYGLVIGRVCEDERGRHVIVLGVLPDEDADAGPGHVQTSHASEFRARSLARFLFPDCTPVGWAHGHLHCGAHFSSVDRENQATWTQPHALGIVVDPWSDPAIAVYRGPDSELLHLVEDEARDLDGRDVAPPVRVPRSSCSCAANLPSAISPPPVQRLPRPASPFTRKAATSVAWTVFFVITWAASAVFGTLAFFRTQASNARLDAHDARLDAIERAHVSADASADAGRPVDDGGAELDAVAGSVVPVDATTVATIPDASTVPADASPDARVRKHSRKDPGRR